MQARMNQQMTLAVEWGIIIDGKQGSAQAWAFLSSHYVPNPVIMRVLGEPGHRRHVDRNTMSVWSAGTFDTMQASK